MQCPVCHGKKETMVFIDGPNKAGCVMLPCDQCAGADEVPDEMTQWIEDGKKLRAKRLHSENGCMSLVQMSAKLKAGLVELSEAERGKRDPKPYLEQLK